MIQRITGAVSTGLLLLAAAASLHGAEIEVVVSPSAHRLERFAANELAGQFRRLFKLPVKVAPALTPGAEGPFVLMGSPQSNPAIRSLAGAKWPKLSDQGLYLQSVKQGTRPGLIVGGGSPRAVLWSAYELGHRFGIRYLLREDVFPPQKAAPKLTGIHWVQEPTLRTRTWRTINDFAHGPESWGIKDQRKLLRQLAKLKFNRIQLAVYPWQSFVHYEFGGIKKQTGISWYGEKFRVDDDIPGRTAFGGAKFFENPDLAGAKTYAERHAAAKRLMQGILDEAHRLGMSVGVAISPLEFPKEFAKALPGLKRVRQLKSLTVGPSGKQSFNDAQLKKLVATKIRAYLDTYPKLDAVYITMPEFPEWNERYEEAWDALSKPLGDRAPALQKLIDSAGRRPLIATGERGRAALRGNIVSLAFFKELFKDSSLLRRADGKQAELVVIQVDPELFAYAPELLPAGASMLNFVDYTARRVAENKKYLARIPADKIRSRLILTLADDNVGVLSQSCVRRIDTLVQEIRKLGWDGFSTRYWDLGELDPTVYYLSRAAYDAKVTARSAHDQLFVALCDKQSVADRLWLAFGHIEKATELIDKHNIGFGFPVRGMFMKHYRAAESPKWLEQATEQYTQAMIELYRSHDNAAPRARPRLFYYAKRGEYVLEYLGAVKAVREAAVAKKKGDAEKTLEHLETALESLYNAIDTLSDVVQNPSDLGLVAVLAEHAYRPLKKEYEKRADAE